MTPLEQLRGEIGHAWHALQHARTEATRAEQNWLNAVGRLEAAAEDALRVVMLRGSA